MKIAVIIPDKNDRPRFLENCLRMIEAQTFKPHIIKLVNNKFLEINSEGYVVPQEDVCDITLRYRYGYESLRNQDIDVVFLMENDDWYSPTYIETMLKELEKHDRPDIFGTNYTIYYHIKLFSHLTMLHNRRSSAMSTILKPDLNFNWCSDNEPYTDLHLWNVIKGVTFKPEKHICIGIKHGTGLCGGRLHSERLHRYINKDINKSFLKAALDPESFKFYSNYFEHETV